MPTAEPAARAAAERAEWADRGSGGGRGRRWVWAGLAVVLLGGLGLRLWGVGQGLPYVYNVDEAEHFVPRAVAMFARGTLDPRYFENPPALTYLLHCLFYIWYGSAHGVERAFALHPGAVYTLARAAVAVLGTAALWLLYLTGARLFNRAAGLLAAAIEAVAFLPVFYGHLALNDAATLAPLTLSLLGTAGVLRKGRPRDYLLAGAGLGLACASKYTAGIVVLPLLAAAATRYLTVAAGAGPSLLGRRAVGGLVLAGCAALAAFLVANPYAILDYHRFHAELIHQSTLSAESQGKLGAGGGGLHNGLVYYLWSFTWGLGWVPALAALGGALTVWRSERRLWWLLVPAALLFLAFMGLQGRYFGRWLLPIFPIVCLLAAFFALGLVEVVSRPARPARPAGKRARGRIAPQSGANADAGENPDTTASASGRRGAATGAGERPRKLRIGLTALLVAALLAQGLVYSVHAGLVLAHADTRNLARRWMLAHIPAGARIVAEPVELEEWAREVKPGTATVSNPYRWKLYPALFLRIAADGSIAPAYIHEVGLENYETTLYPALIDFYEREGYCWVITGSTESGRAFADPQAAPGAIAYYRALAEQGEVVYRASPYGRGQGTVAFNFDWSFDYYPLAYDRPGPEMTIYRLHGARCGR